MDCAGIGFEAPNEEDVFGDASPCKGRASQIMVEELGATLRTLPRGRKVLSNPPAGTVRQEEFDSAVWLIKTKSINDRENDKAEAALHTKKIFGLAKQTQLGLAQIGGKYEMTSIATVKSTSEVETIRVVVVIGTPGMAGWLAVANSEINSNSNSNSAVT